MFLIPIQKGICEASVQHPVPRLPCCPVFPELWKEEWLLLCWTIQHIADTSQSCPVRHLLLDSSWNILCIYHTFNSFLVSKKNNIIECSSVEEGFFIVVIYVIRSFSLLHLWEEEFFSESHSPFSIHLRRKISSKPTFTLWAKNITISSALLTLLHLHATQENVFSCMTGYCK